MGNTRPLVAAACLCEKVLVEKDGVASVIRIIDTITVTRAPTLPENIRPFIELTAFISLRSGDVSGEQQVSLVARYPSGKEKQTGEWKPVLTGGQQGSHLTLVMQLEAGEYGLYSLDVVWRGEVLTSIPFKLVEGQHSVQGQQPRTSS